MGHLTLSPAYGRDYKSKKEVEAAWQAGKDFIIETYGHPYSGKPVNIEAVDALLTEGVREVNVRFKQQRSVCVIKLAHKVRVPA